MNDATRRGLRTLLQVGIVQAAVQFWNAFAPTHLTAEQTAAITVLATPILAFAQNFLEDTTSLPAMLKRKPSGASSGDSAIGG